MTEDKCPGGNNFSRLKIGKEVKCPGCGTLIEFWTDEFVKECDKCKTLVSTLVSREGAKNACVFTCLLWDNNKGACVPRLSKETKDYINRERKKGG